MQIFRIAENTKNREIIIRKIIFFKMVTIFETLNINIFKKRVKLLELEKYND